MYALEIQYEYQHHYLFGELITAPVKGCRRKAGKEVSEYFEEQIEVILQGNPGLIDQWLRAIETVFSKISKGSDKGLMVLQTDQRVAPYESRIISGKIGFLGHGSSDLRHGGMGVLLTIVRENYWSGGLIACELSNVHGDLKVTGLTIDNSFSSANGKNNFAIIHGTSIKGELPAPARVIIENLNDGITIRKIVVGLDTFYGLCAGENWLEGESGASELSTSIETDSGASGGNYRKTDWPGSEEVEVIQWTIGAETAGRIDGRMVRPVLRLANPLLDNETWIRVAVRQGEAVEKSAWLRIGMNERMIVLPAIHLPPYGLGQGTTESATFSILARRSGAGPHSLSIDYVSLMPADGMRIYSSLGAGGLAEGERLIDALEDESIYSEAEGSELRKLTHQAVGKGIWLIPNTGQNLYLLFDNSGGGCGIEQQVRLKIYHQSRRKNV